MKPKTALCRASSCLLIAVHQRKMLLAGRLVVPPLFWDGWFWRATRVGRFMSLIPADELLCAIPTQSDRDHRREKHRQGVIRPLAMEYSIPLTIWALSWLLQAIRPTQPKLID